MRENSRLSLFFAEPLIHNTVITSGQWALHTQPRLPLS
jgi:hypothetical protein